MSKPLCAVIPLPKHCILQGLAVPTTCPLQAAAEQHLLMLQRLLSLIPSQGGSVIAQSHLSEVCRHAGEMLGDMAVLYRRALSQATVARADNDQAL
jgi:Ser/Thr protein kinase RdoA (MazF antagonist)